MSDRSNEDKESSPKVDVRVTELPPGNSASIEADIEAMKVARIVRAEGVEGERLIRAETVEGDRVIRAEGVEGDRVTRARGLEGDRVTRAENIEISRSTLATELEINRTALADQLEVDRKLHSTEDERKRQIRASRVNKQILVLAVFLVFSFIVVAYRSETNARKIEETAHAAEVKAYETCLASQKRTEEINPGRYELVDLLVTLVNTNDQFSAEQRQTAAQTLQEGLILPLVTCGDDPR